MRRLFPEPGSEITVEEAYAAPLGAHADRPWVGLCMVSSIDGSIAVSGTSGGLSSDTDAAVLGRLRQLADVVVVGSGTVADEGYGPPKKPGQRIAVVTGSGNVDVESALFQSGAALLITTETTEVPTRPGLDVIRAGTDEVDLAAAIGALGAVVEGCAYVLAEGGAALNGALLDAGLLDELNVTTSATTVGGAGPRLATGADEQATGYDAAQIAIDDEGFVYTRWLRRR